MTHLSGMAFVLHECAIFGGLKAEVVRRMPGTIEIYSMTEGGVPCFARYQLISSTLWGILGAAVFFTIDEQPIVCL